MFADLLRADRERFGLSTGQAASRIGISPAEYRRLEAGDRWPSWEAYDRICRAFGWPRSFH
jgi:transcriptional regulator with XRE-family HTH domain